jgi:hypothetical protein
VEAATYHVHLIHHARVVERDVLGRQIGGSLVVEVELAGVVREVEALAVRLDSVCERRGRQESGDGLHAREIRRSVRVDRLAKWEVSS